MIISLASCSIRRHVPEDKMILKRNNIEIHSKDVDFTRSDISGCLSQQSNPKFLGFMPLTWVYYMTENKTDKKFYNWINNNIGEEPVYYSNEMREKSVSQIIKYLGDIGYFNSIVSNKVKNKKGIGKVYYEIYPAQPYIIEDITYKISDTTIYEYVMRIQDMMPVKEGDIYNAFKLDD